MDFLGLITSAFGGGLTGLIGSAVSKVFEYKTKKLEIEAARERFTHEVALRKVDAEIMKEEWAARTKVADIEATAKIEVADSAAFAESIKSDDKNYLDYLDKLNDKQDWFFVILEFLRGSIRPFLTLYLCGITTLVYIKATRLMNADIILPGMAYDMVTNIINTVLYLTTTCVLWWFGTRNSEKRK